MFALNVLQAEDEAIEKVWDGASEIISRWDEDEAAQLTSYYKKHIDAFGDEANKYPELFFRYYSSLFLVRCSEIDTEEYIEVKNLLNIYIDEYKQNLQRVEKNPNCSKELTTVLEINQEKTQEFTKIFNSFNDFESFVTYIEETADIPEFYIRRLELFGSTPEEQRANLYQRLESDPAYKKRVFDLLQAGNDEPDVALFRLQRIEENFGFNEKGEIELEYTLETSQGTLTVTEEI